MTTETESIEKTSEVRGRTGTSFVLQPRDLLTALPGIVLVLATYVWLVSNGTWTSWPRYSEYYDQLARAFSQGHLWLDRKPDPALLALPDPYDPDMRQGLPFLSDASLYHDRYYLYFGPVPGLILLVVRIVLPIAIGDQYLAFGFTFGTFLVLTLFSLRIWKRFFPEIPPWVVGYSILTVGLVSPFGWIVGNRAAVHDAAIAAGQFFLLAGLYMAFIALDGETITIPGGIAAGILWGAALGSRITQIIPVALIVIVVLVASFRKENIGGSVVRLIRNTAVFVGPIVTMLAALGWYNWTRFGSILETGISYQLALLHFQKYPGDVFSIRYIPQNLYNYLLMPARLRFNFPYIWPRMGIRSSIISGVALPALYFAENITGLLYTTPFLVLSLVGGIVRKPAIHSGGSNQLNRDLFRWLQATLIASLLGGFAFFLAFFWASERYLLDFIPSALLLSLIGFWYLITSLRSRPLHRAALVVLVLGLMFVSILVSSLLAVAQNADAFRSLNPALWAQLNNLFRP